MTVLYSQSLSHRDYNAAIDGLRMIAVMLVTLYHLRVPYLDGGFVGVDIFFVISGYLITGKIVADIKKDQFSLSDFWCARIRRIFPALLTVVGATYLISLLVMSPIALAELSAETIAASLSISNIYFWMGSGYFDGDAYTKPLLHTWSLGVEEQFYLLWPLLLIFLFRFKSSTIIILLSILFLFSLFYSQKIAISEPSTAFFLLPFRVFQFLIGGAAAFIASKIIIKRGYSEFLTLIGLALMAYSAIYFTEATPFPGINALYPSIGAILCIMFGNAGYLSTKFLANPMSKFIGNISYSLYLVHWPLITIYEYITMKTISGYGIVIALIIMVTLAYLLFTFIETPTRQKLKDKSFKVSTKKLVTWCLALSVSYATIASFIYKSGGWSWRVAEIQQELAALNNAEELHAKLFGGRACAVKGCQTHPNTKLPEIFLIGDSHARALYTGLQKHFPDYNFIIYAPNACPMFSVRFLTNKDKYSPECTVIKDIAFKEIKAAKDPIVIIHQHWAPRISKKIYDTKNRSKQFSFKSNASIEAGAKFAIQEISAMKKMLGIKKLIMIGGVPRYAAPLSPLDCLTRPIESDVCKTSDLNTATVKIHHTLNQAISTIQHDDIEFIDPYPSFCNSVSCQNTHNDYPLYTDTTHLSVWGSDFLIDSLKDDLRSIIIK